MTVALNEMDETGRLSNGAYVVHSMDITDAMKQSVLYEGQPRFSVKVSDFGFTGEVRAARGIRLNGEEKRTVSSKIMSGDAQIDLDYLQGRTRSLDFEYVFEIYSDGSVEITDVRSNADINKVIMKQREEQRNAGRYGNERQAFPGRNKTRHDGRTATYVRTGDNVVRRSGGRAGISGEEPGRNAARDYTGAQENTRQADVDPETEALFSAENALRFAVSGAPQLPGKSSAHYGAEYTKTP